MSALGHKRIFCDAGAMSALLPKADMCGATRYVRFVPISRPLHSITSSARASSVGGTARPRAFVPASENSVRARFTGFKFRL